MPAALGARRHDRSLALSVVQLPKDRNPPNFTNISISYIDDADAGSFFIEKLMLVVKLFSAVFEK